MTEVIKLNFLTDQEKNVSIRISRANPSATNLQINNAMDNFIKSGAFETKGRGDIISKVGAELIVTNVTNFDVA